MSVTKQSRHTRAGRGEQAAIGAEPGCVRSVESVSTRRQDTMKLHRIAALGLAVALVVTLSTTLASADDKQVKSGPQVGDDLAGPFHPLNVNGKKAGEKHCLYCENGDRPVVMVFAR